MKLFTLNFLLKKEVHARYVSIFRSVWALEALAQKVWHDYVMKYE